MQPAGCAARNAWASAVQRDKRANWTLLPSLQSAKRRKKKRNWKVRAPPGQPWSHLPYTATAQRWPRPGWSREKTLRGDLGVRSVLNRGDPSGRWMSAEVMASPRRPGQSLRELSVTSYHRSCSRSALLELSQEVPGFARYTRLPGILSRGILTRREHEEKVKLLPCARRQRDGPAGDCNGQAQHCGWDPHARLGWNRKVGTGSQAGLHSQFTTA